MTEKIVSSDNINKIVTKVMPSKNNGIHKYSSAMAKAFRDYEINTINRIAGFLAQTGHESGSFSRIEENLNYSAERLKVVFPKYFPTDGLAHAYEYNKQAVANRVYGNRMGNGPESSGDGWKYRGRGLIQLTGKSNYEACSKDMMFDIVQEPELVLIPEIAVLTSIWYWNHRKINEACDADDIVKMTKLVQGGRLGLEERKSYYEKFKAILSDLTGKDLTNI